MKTTFAKKYYQAFVRTFAALLIAALTLLFVYAFSQDWLPYSSDGDAFDTIYAIEQSDAVNE